MIKCNRDVFIKCICIGTLIGFNILTLLKMKKVAS